MLSKKMTFSLMSLITLLAFAFVVPFATAGVLGDKFSTTITLNHIADPPQDGGPPLVGDNQVQTGAISIKVVFGKAIARGDDPTPAETDGPIPASGMFTPADVTVVAFDKTTGASPEVAITVTSAPIFVPGVMNEATFILGEIAANTVVLVTIAEGAVTNNDPADVIAAGTGDDTLGGNAKATLQFDVVAAVDENAPRVVSVEDLPAVVIAPGNPDSFTFKVILSEKPKEFKKGHIDVDVARATVDTEPIALPAMTGETTNDSTEESGRVYPYLVTVTPKYESKDDIVIKIKSFDDTTKPTALKSLVTSGYVVKVLSDANKKVGLSGTEINLTNKAVIPKDGYLVVAKDKGASFIVDPGNAEHGAADIARRDRAF